MNKVIKNRWTKISKMSINQACALLRRSWKDSSVDLFRQCTGTSPFAQKILSRFNTMVWRPHAPIKQFHNHEYMVLLKMVHLGMLECQVDVCGDNKDRLLFRLPKSDFVTT